MPGRVISFKSCAEIPDDLFETLLEHVTLRQMGEMSGRARRYRMHNVQKPVVVVFEDDLPVSWMLFDDENRVEMYTRPSYRRRGYASTAMQVMMKLLDNFTPGIWNEPARMVRNRAQQELIASGEHINLNSW